MRIMFMGTPEFAMLCLKEVCESGEDVIAVVATPDKPKGRGMVLTPCEVKKYAIEKGIKVYQPTTLKDGAFLDTLKELDPELIIVVAYGKILPEYVLSYPRYGCINAHASILPKYRGAAPIQRAIIDGESETGVSIMQMDAGLDTGDVLHIEKVSIDSDDNFESVHDKLVTAGSAGLLKTIQLFKDGKAQPRKQGEDFTYAEKITKSDCLIDFNDTVRDIHNRIRGLSPYPLAYTRTPDGKVLKIVSAHISDEKRTECREVVKLDDSVHVSCRDGVIALDTVIPEGKGRMDAKSFINGRKLSIGDRLGE